MASFVRIRTSLARVFALIIGTVIVALYPEIGVCVCPLPDKTPIAIQIDSAPPTDIKVNGIANSPCATLQQAGAFAWHEFIALNWPATTSVDGQPARDMPASGVFGDASFTGPLVWHTFRGKVEIFPMDNSAAYNSGLKDYGYDQPPSYSYQGNGVKINLPPGADKPGYPTPWINLDENSQIGLNKIYAGVVSSTPRDANAQILFTAKANRAEYRYITENQWWSPPPTLFTRTALFVKNFGRDPRANTNDCDGQSAQGTPPTKNCVSLPNGSIEVKAGWRKLTADEAKSGRFYTTQVRHYINPSNDIGNITAVDEPMGLVGLHIIQKTPTAPYFIYATFEQADNITAADGSPIEDEDGNYKVLSNTTPMTPDVVSQNAGPGPVQKFVTPSSYPASPGKQLYYQNIVGSADHGLLDGGIILVNKRINDIPPEIVSINKLAHTTISSYAAQKHLTGKPVWMYYKLVNVQYVPISGKVSGIDDYPRSTYYQSNSVIETDYNLQKFSGKFVNFGNKQFNITDFMSDDGKNYTDLLNVAHNGGAVNMGGCMGCHGNSQKAGGDFSFILFDAPVLAPEWDSKSLNDTRFLRFAAYPKRP